MAVTTDESYCADGSEVVLAARKADTCGSNSLAILPSLFLRLGVAFPFSLPPADTTEDVAYFRSNEHIPYDSMDWGLDGQEPHSETAHCSGRVYVRRNPEVGPAVRVLACLGFGVSNALDSCVILVIVVRYIDEEQQGR